MEIITKDKFTEPHQFQQNPAEGGEPEVSDIYFWSFDTHGNRPITINCFFQDLPPFKGGISNHFLTALGHKSYKGGQSYKLDLFIQNHSHVYTLNLD